MIEIAVIGAGNLGSRHLQALARLDRPARIVVVEPSAAARETAQARHEQVLPAGAPQSVRYAGSLDAIDRPVDVAIVATNSDIRADAIRQLVARVPVRALVLEKVLFGRLDDYDAVGALLAEKGIAAWVNCPRRMWPFYRDIHRRLAGAVPRELRVTGADWGLGCNTIHMLDLAAWISGSSTWRVAALDLDRVIHRAKRAGFIELTGAISGAFENGPVFSIASWDSPTRPFMLEIVADDLVCIAREEEGTAWVAERASGWQWREESCTPMLQSELTHLVVAEIVDRGTAPLTRYAESVALHRPMIEAFVGHLRRLDPARAPDRCPVT